MRRVPMSAVPFTCGSLAPDRETCVVGPPNGESAWSRRAYDRVGVASQNWTRPSCPTVTPLSVPCSRATTTCEFRSRTCWRHYLFQDIRPELALPTRAPVPRRAVGSPDAALHIPEPSNLTSHVELALASVYTLTNTGVTLKFRHASVSWRAFQRRRALWQCRE